MSHARVTPAALAHLNELKTALQRDFGLKSSTEDIASALIGGISVPQLAGLLIAYNKDTAEKPEQSAQNS